MRHLLLASSLLLSSAALGADNFYYHCSNGQENRDIAVTYPKAPDATPCEVHYYKHDDDQLLWQATTQKNYCESKAERFATEQRLHGFPCERRSGDSKKTAT